MGQGREPGMAQFNMAAMDKMWPTVPAEMLEAFWGKQFNPEGLDAKTRLLLTLQGLTIQGAVAEAQIRLTVRHAHRGRRHQAGGRGSHRHGRDVRWRARDEQGDGTGEGRHRRRGGVR
jgi:hypothetical protein